MASGKVMEATTAKRAVPWRLGDVLAVMGLALVVGIVAISVAAAVVGSAADGDTDIPRLTSGLAATIAFDVVLLGLAVAFSVGKYRCHLSDLGFRRPRWGSWWLPLTTVAALWLVLGVYLGIVQAAGAEGLQPQSTLDDDIFDTPLVIGLAATLALVAAPIAEETFFRGFLFAGLRYRWGLVMAALVSGLLFGLLHFDAGSIIPFSLIGIVLALAYTVSGSIWVTIASHFLFNLVSFLAAIAVSGGGGG
ncbi:MAG: lysostaphin resistance A-like protein [Dehalococcoidia bacterium]